MSKEAIVIRLEAKHDRAKELETILRSKIEQIKTDEHTNSWYLLKLNEVAFSIFATFSSEEAAKQHTSGAVVKSILAIADEYLTKAPSISPLEVLASKIGDKTTIAPETPAGTRKYNLRFIDGL